MTFPRNVGGQGGDLMPPSRPKFSVADEGQTPENLLDAVAEPRAAAGERDPRSLAASPDKCTNVIAAGSRWKGSLAIPDSVRIEGQFNGDIDARGTVQIAEGAVVEAKIKAAFVVISGQFKGEIRCSERLELLPRSKVQGDMITKVLNVHEGATVDGSIRMSDDKAGEAATAAPAATPRASRDAESRTPEAQTNGTRSGRSLED